MTREVYRFLGAEDRTGIWYRDGEHDHGTADWQTFLELMEWQLCGRQPQFRFDRNPYPDMHTAFLQSAPGVANGKDSEPADAGDS